MSTPRAYTQFPSQADLFYSLTTSSTSEEDLNFHYSPPSKSSLRIGVLILSEDQHQLFDIAAIGLLTMISRSQISKLHPNEAALREAVDEIDIRYITESGEGSFPVTSGARLPVTNSFENAPQLDVLAIPGTFSTGELPMSATTFIARQTTIPSRVAVFSIASGVSALTQTGILHGKRATGPQYLLSSLRQRYPETHWREGEWTRHDNIWSSSSAVAAVDMLAAWMREYYWDRREAVECALSAAGVSPSGRY